MQTILRRALLSTAALSLTCLPMQLLAQTEGEVPTQILVHQQDKQPDLPAVTDLKLSLNGKVTPVAGTVRIAPTTTQVAILIDDGLRISFGRNFGELKDWLRTLPPGLEVSVGYMQNGRIVTAIPFTTNVTEQLDKIRLPMGMAGINSSPYFCLSDFIKHWQPSPQRSSRVVLMITNGVDPYNGSTSVLNQNSPYVDEATKDAQRAGIPVYSIYATDAREGAGRDRISGQNYLSQIAGATGGQLFYQGLDSPISLTPFLNQFGKALTETFALQFNAPGQRKLLTVKLANVQRSKKMDYPAQVQPGSPAGEQ